MEIRDFDRIRAGGYFPACIDIEKIGGHDTYGVMARAFFQRSDICAVGYLRDSHRVEVRLTKDSIYLLNYRYDDEAPPKWLEGSTLLWESHPVRASP